MKYSQEHINFLSDNVKGRSFQELTDMFNQAFLTTLTLKQIRCVCENRHLKCGRNTRFNPGHIPFNKDTKGFIKKNLGSFKKGHIPKNHKPVGSQRINVDGYIEVKISEPKKWKLKHVIEWEQVYGVAPTGHCIIFMDGNKMNININNLMPVKRGELLYLNQNKMIFKDVDLTKTAVNVAKLAVKVFEKQKEQRSKQITKRQNKNT